MALFNLARMTVSSSGTGTITLNAAVSGFLTFDAAGCSTAAAGQAITYAIGDTTQSEIASGTYFSTSLTVTRGSSTSGLKSTNSNSPINMSNAAQVIITPQAAGIHGRVVFQSFTADGTYTPTTGMITASIECIGGGGGGGGVDGVGGLLLAGGGGGGGGYSRTICVSSAVGASQVVTVGAGGAGGVASAVGSSGGATSVGSLCIALGGAGGTSAANLQYPTGGAGAVLGTGNLTSYGDPGFFGHYHDITTDSVIYSGRGGDSFYGPGAASVSLSSIGASSSNGTNASANTGGGGSGGVAWDVENAVNGGNGGSGVVYVTEYCSL